MTSLPDPGTGSSGGRKREGETASTAASKICSRMAALCHGSRIHRHAQSLPPWLSLPARNFSWFALWLMWASASPMYNENRIKQSKASGDNRP